MRNLSRPAGAYVAAVVLAATATLVALAQHEPGAGSWALLALLAVLTIAGEMRPIRVPMGLVGMEITVSTTFGFAITLLHGPLYGCVAMAVAALVADTAARKAVWKALFNAAQYVLAMAAGGLILELAATSDHHVLAGRGMFSSGLELVPYVVACGAFFLTNIVILAVALALVARAPVVKVLREDFTYQVFASAALLALSPIVVVVGQRSLALLPILLIPLGAAYKTALVSLEKEHQSLHDGLTGLPNRTLLHRRISEITNRPPGSRATAAVLLIDLDRFKEINDSLGHATGDRVLCELGPRLQQVLDDNATVARLGGDEFGVVLPDLRSAEEAHEAGRRLLDAIRQPITLDDFDLEVGGSIGLAMYPCHGTDADSLIQHADIAMYAAKDNLAGIVEYDSALDHTSPLQLLLVKELRDAIAAGEGIVVHYQPKVDVASGSVVGAEALVRWEHPVRGMIRPDEFIPVAEQTGLIRELTVVVLGRAVAQCAAWHRMGRDIPVSVNISARTLLDLDLPERIDELMSQHGLSPDHLVLEITESTIMSDLERTRSQLAQLKRRGASISLDDYGTGHSSLAQIKSLPLDELKIDKSFITYMTEESQDAHIASSTIELAQRLGLQVVAEGVETAEGWRLLQGMGCHHAQGYYFSGPLPAEQFDRWLLEYEWRSGERHEAPPAQPLPAAALPAVLPQAT